MSITSGFFNSINGDRRYNAEQMSTYFEGLISDGIYENIGDKFVVTANRGMTINVGTGRAILQSHWIKNDATLALTLDAADSQLPRIDSIVIKLDKTESVRDIDVVIKKGTPAQNPSAPSVERSEDIFELQLATIRVKKNVPTITQNNITDTRSSSLCGWVTGVVKQVDTSDLFLQWQAAYEQQFADFDAYMEAKKAEFDDWFSSLTKTLNVNMQLVKYQNTLRTTWAPITTNIIIGIPEFDADNDILLTFINGVLLIEEDEYTILGTGARAFIFLKKEIEGENTVTFIVLKNIIGKPVLTAGESIRYTVGTIQSNSGVTESGE